LPLLPSGKVDRTSLLARPAERPDDRAAVAPRTDTEKLVARAWQQVFGPLEIGVDDHFFDLGGHSLMLARVQGILGRELDRDVPMTDLISHPTVAALARLLDAGPAARDTAALGILLPIRPEGSAPPLFCVHAATGLSWQYAGLRRHIDPDVPIYGIQARGFDRPRPLARTLTEMTEEYLAHLRSVRPQGPYRLLGLSFGGVLVHLMATRLRELGEEVSLLSILDAYPRYPWEPFSADYEQKALRSLLYMSGYDLNRLGDEPLRHARVARLIRAERGVLSTVEDATLSAIVDNFINSAVLQQSAEFGRFDGDLLFFTATVSRRDDQLTADRWAPYVEGVIDNHDVAVPHDDLLTTEALATIGPVLAERLRQH
jgi:nonribosomal peptide synthetase DhbF